MQKGLKIPTLQRPYFIPILSVIVVAFLGIITFAAASQTNPPLVIDRSLLSGEIFELDSNNTYLANENLNVVLSFPQDQSASKLMTIRNKETSLSVFSIDGNAFVFFESPNKDEKIKVRNPLSVPVTSNNGVSSFSINVDEKDQTITLTSDAVSHSWTPPQETRDLNFTQIQSGNTQDLDVVITEKNSFDIRLMICIMLFLSSVLILYSKRALLQSSFSDIFRLVRTKPILGDKMIVGTLIAGFALITLLSSAPPSGNLISTSVDAAKISSSDLFVMNEKFKGGWLFTNPPDLGLQPEDYTTSLSFDIFANLDSEERFTELFALGLPQGKLDSPISVENLELSMNAKQRVSFKVPSQDGRSTWYSEDLKPGIHRIHGEIRNGREVELSVDDTLIYAMATDTSHYFLQKPNLFMSEYLINNLESGNISWSINSEGECWCGQRWDGEKMCFQRPLAQGLNPNTESPGDGPQAANQPD